MSGLFLAIYPVLLVVWYVPRNLALRPESSSCFTRYPVYLPAPPYLSLQCAPEFHRKHTPYRYNTVLFSTIGACATCRGRGNYTVPYVPFLGIQNGLYRLQA